MTKDFFHNQVKRLMEVYGEKNYPAERIKVFWEAFKFEKEAAFEKAISKLIGELYTAPPISKLKESVLANRGPINREEIPEKTYRPCALCNCTGVVTAKRRENQIYEVVFRCPCDAGEQFKARVEVWDERHYRSYILVSPIIDEPITRIKTSKELAEEYGPKISAMLRGIGAPLPYDQNERIPF